VANIAVVTDSVASIPKEISQKLNIHIAPIHITWDKVRYRDGVDLDPNDFYKRLKTSKTLPTTSSAVQGEFLKIYESLRGKVDGIVAVLLTGGLGAAVSTATTAKNMVPDIPIEIVDTKSACTAEGFAAIAAAKAAVSGAGIEQVAQAARDIVKKAHVYIVMDTLEYLRRGGRINYPAAIFANLLKFKPVMTIEPVEGKLQPVAKPRTREKSIEYLIKLIKEHNTGTPLHMAINDADAIEDANKLKEQIVSLFHPVEMLMTTFTPVIGTHLGPGALCINFYNE
jgi:DegV family protein with EDD domain